MHLSNTALAQYFDQTLAAEQRASIEQHAAACEGCHELLRRLGYLVSELSQTPGASTTDSGPIEEPLLPLLRGTPVGRYLLLERLGGGGMGVVYAAFDPALDRTVALKFMRESVGPHRAQRIAEREAKAMARLSHPNVVGVFDVGTLAGRTFLAVEYVEGTTLGAWLTRPGHLARAIGEAFLAAGRGLEAVHASGLVHGDFKPANVLVSTRGQVKVSDFGLARDAVSLETQLLGAGTAAYMAPEVREGHPADASSDQFSFATALNDALKAVPASRLQRRLVAIASRGCEAAPPSRYTSLGQLLAALERALAARRASVVALVLATLAVAAVSVGLAMQARHAAPCQGLDALMTDTWSASRREALAAAFEKVPEPFALATFASVARTLDAYSASWVTQRTDACLATHVRHDQSAELLDLRVDCLERRKLELVATVRELERAEKLTVSRAVDMVAALEPLARCEDRRSLLDRSPWPNGALSRAALEAAWQQLALAKATRWAGRFTDTQVAHRAVELARATDEPHLVADALVLLADFQTGADASATSWHALSAAEAGRNDIAKAQALFKLLEKELDRPPEQRRLAELIALSRAAVARVGNPPLLTLSLNRSIGSALRKSGQVSESIKILRAAVKAAESSDAVPVHQLAVTWNALGGALLFANQNEEALTALQEAHRLLLVTVGSEHPLVAQTEVNLGAALNALDRFGEAETALSHAQLVYERTLGQPNAFLPGVLINLAQTDIQLGQPERGLERAQRALALYTEASGPSSANVALAHAQIGQALGRLRRSREAIAHLKQALALYEKIKGDEHPELVDTLELLGMAMSEADVHDFTSAEQMLNRARRIVAANMGAMSCASGRVAYLLGRVKRLAAHPAAALFDEAIVRCQGHGDGLEVLALAKFERARASFAISDAQHAFETYSAMLTATPELKREMSQWLMANKRRRARFLSASEPRVTVGGLVADHADAATAADAERADSELHAAQSGGAVGVVSAETDQAHPPLG